jgi:hypothetical protein
MQTRKPGVCSIVVLLNKQMEDKEEKEEERGPTKTGVEDARTRGKLTMDGTHEGWNARWNEWNAR